MQAHAVSAVTVRPASSVRGRLRVPGDKSISHRYAMMAALADGPSDIAGYSTGADCEATLRCLRALGVEILVRPVPPDPGSTPGAATLALAVMGRGLRGLAQPPGPVDLANSGTAMRLMAGILAAHPYTVHLTGDPSLCRRPMRRIMEPLRLMGATLRAADDDRPPLEVRGADLVGIDYAPPIASAQVKSAVLLAGLQANGRTTIREAAPTRDHTERALRAFGAAVERRAFGVSLQGGQRLAGTSLSVPGDASAAAFWAVAAAALPGSDVEIIDVGLNPTRTALLDLLAEAGARVERRVSETTGGEPSGTLRVRPGPGTLGPLMLGPADVPGLIDELPVLAALGTRATEVSVRGAAELRAKESDRIAATVSGLRALGADVLEFPDGFRVRPAGPLRGGAVDAAGDHRLAMSFAVAALGADGPVTISGAEAVDVSYPGFFAHLEALRR